MPPCCRLVRPRPTPSGSHTGQRGASLRESGRAHVGSRFLTLGAERVAEYQSKFKDRAALYKDGKDRVEKVREYNRKLPKSH
jgi:hypothetical protein